jgi:hypothetical protein
VEQSILAVLTAELEAQMSAIDQICTKIQIRAIELDPSDEIRMESIAYQIHNLYNAVEDLLKLIAAYFENQITDTAKWHSALLRRMTQEVVDIRPAFLSSETYELLNALRGFRRFFRHAYGTPIDYAQLQANLEKASNLQPLLRQDLDRFLQALKNMG